MPLDVISIRRKNQFYSLNDLGGAILFYSLFAIYLLVLLCIAPTFHPFKVYTISVYFLSIVFKSAKGHHKNLNSNENKIENCLPFSHMKCKLRRVLGLYSHCISISIVILFHKSLSFYFALLCVWYFFCRLEIYFRMSDCSTLYCVYAHHWVSWRCVMCINWASSNFTKENVKKERGKNGNNKTVKY